jgi:hypothetical protein
MVSRLWKIAMKCVHDTTPADRYVGTSCLLALNTFMTRSRDWIVQEVGNAELSTAPAARAIP